MIPNLTAAECGALLVAVGKHMIDHNVTAEAVLDFSDRADPITARQTLLDTMVDAEWSGMSEDRAALILHSVTLEEAITFNLASGSWHTS